MKECERVNNLFGELHDRMLESETDKVAREHLRECIKCREEFKWYGFTVQALTNLEKVAPPEDFMAQLNSRLYSPAPSFAFSHFFKNFFSSAPFLPIPVGAAALVFVTVMGFVLYNHAPTDVWPTGSALSTLQSSSTRPVAGPISGTGDLRDMRATNMQVARQFEAPLSTAPVKSSVQIPLQSVSNPKSFDSGLRIMGGLLPTTADTIGGDNLTVESPSVEAAVESVKRMLPNLQGRLVAEKTGGAIRERVLGVSIPSNAYGNLTTELINHGAVAIAATKEAATPAPSKSDGNNVVLYIHFVHTP